MRAVTATQAAALIPGFGSLPACRRETRLRSETPERASTSGAEVDYVARAAAGDVRAFEHLYRTHLPKVHSLVRRMAGNRDTDELTQDVFVRVWQKLGSFRGDSAFGTWLHRLAVNVVIERFRQDATRRQRNLGDQEAEPQMVKRQPLQVPGQLPAGAEAGADPPDDLGTEPCARYGLVRALAPGHPCELGAGDGLPRARQPLAAGDEVEVDRPHDGDRRPHVQNPAV